MLADLRIQKRTEGTAFLYPREKLYRNTWLQQLLQTMVSTLAAYLNPFNLPWPRRGFRTQEPPPPPPESEAAPTCCPAAMQPMLVALGALIKCDPDPVLLRVALYVIRLIYRPQSPGQPGASFSSGASSRWG